MYGADANADGNDRETTFKITSTKLYVPIVTLSTKDNVNLTKQLNERFKRSVYWNEYKSKIETKEADANNLKRFPLDASFQGVNRLFFLLLTILIMVLIDLKETLIENISNFNFNDQIKKYDEIKKIATGKGDDYTTGCLLDYQYFKDHYQLFAVDLSKQKQLDADPRVVVVAVAVAVGVAVAVAVAVAVGVGVGVVVVVVVVE